MIRIIFLLFFLNFATTLNADTLYLKNGRHMEGIVKSEDNVMVELEVSGGTVKFKKSEIENIEKTNEEETILMRQKWDKDKISLQNKIEKQRIEEEKQPKKVSFSKDSKGIMVVAKLNNKVDATLMLDTGATLIFLRKDIARQLGINMDNVTPDSSITVGDGRKVDAKYVTLDSVKVENVEAFKVGAAIMLNEAGDPGFRDGLLGMSFLKNFSFEVNQKENKLILKRLE